MFRLIFGVIISPALRGRGRRNSLTFACVKDLRDFLETKYRLYGQASFIETDPVSIPHRFSRKEDREIAGFLAATIAWGQRKTILANARQLLALMDDAPYDFILGHTRKDLARFHPFVHRTFNGMDCIFF